MEDQIKVRTSTGSCYYINEKSDENGEHHGSNKYTDTAARLRWSNEEWVVVWEEPFIFER